MGLLEFGQDELLLWLDCLHDSFDEARQINCIAGSGGAGQAAVAAWIQCLDMVR